MDLELRMRTAGGLVMSPLIREDAQPLHALWTTAGVRRFLWDDEVIPFDRTQQIVETNERLFADRRFGLWGAWRDDRRARATSRGVGQSPTLIGFGGFWHFRAPPVVELLYGVAEDAWGEGIATDVGRAVVDYGFNTLRMPVVRASTDVGNAASVRVLEKLGFQQTRRAVVGGLDTRFFELAVSDWCQTPV